jgi:hypothetical protein
MNPAIVYLAQNTRKDAQYGRDSRSLLMHSLDLLFANYNNRFKQTVLIFHEGDFSPEDQKAVARGRTEIQFKEIHFETPSFLRKEEIPEIWGGKFGMGHRHMIRFYAVQVFDILEALGIDWFFRMDDDSFIHSKIDYDLFGFMESNNYEYGYRVDVREPEFCTHGFSETVEAYLVAERIKPTFFYDNVNCDWVGQISPMNLAKIAVKKILMRVNPNKKYVLNSPAHATYGYLPKRGSFFQYNLWGYYNNFFITKVGFWKRPDVQAFLHYLDRIGGGYKYRWNDLITQTAAVQIFMPKEKVHKFTDWTYEHATVINGKLCWGGIYEGAADRDSQAVKEFVASYGNPRCGQSY